MYWKQSEKTDPSNSQQIHQGDGFIKRRSLFSKVSQLPIKIEVWELEEGVSEGDHTHEDDGSLEEMYYFLEGEGEMTVNGKSIGVSANDSVRVPPGVDHGIRNIGDKPLKMIIIWGVPNGQYTKN